MISKEEDEVTFDVEILDCRDGDDAYLDKLVLMRDGKEIKSFKPEWGSSFTIENLDAGVYQFEYTSMFDIKVSKTVDATKSGKYLVQICTNYLDYSKEKYQPVLDRMKSGQKYSIYFESLGCFHSIADTLTISRVESNYVAKYEGTERGVDSAGIEALRHFEFELNHVKNGGCTTTEAYSVDYAGRVVSKAKDGSCNWWGFRFLLRDLGFTKE